LRVWPFRFARRNDELDEELRAHLALAAKDLEERGLSPREAAARARREFGNENVVREATRDVWGGSGLESMGQDLRYALRGLGRNPGFTAAVVLSLAVGVGANTAVFSLTDATLNRPLPFAEPDRLVAFFEESPSKGRTGEGVAPGNLLDWREARDVLSGLAGYYTHSSVITEEENAEVVIGAQVTEDFFPVFGVAPLAGRVFTAEENEAGISGVSADPPPGPVVVSERLAMRRFGGASAALGKRISIDGTPRTVVGVMPASFVPSGAEAQLWLPWDLVRGYARLETVPRDFRFLDATGRLRPGVTLEQAQGRLAGIAAGLARDHPATNAGWGVTVAPFAETVVGNTRPTLLGLFAGVVLVLILTCANVANLQIARGMVRERELAVRLALGVSPRRLFRQLMTESLLVSSIGGMLGVLLSALLLKYLQVFAPPSIVALQRIAIDGRVLLFALGVTCAAGLASGMLPALRTSRVSLVSVFRGGARDGASGLRRGPRRLLVVAQVAIALVLLAGALLLTRSVAALRRVDPGFEVDQRLMLRVSLNLKKYRTGSARIDYFEGLVEGLRAIPGVRNVTGTTVLPMSEGGTDFSRPYWREDRPRPEGVPAPVDIRMVLPGYVKTMGMRMLRGRAIDETDGRDDPTVVMINDRLAKATWPDENPVGKRIVLDYRGGAYPYEIVGVVNDTRYYGPRVDARPEVFIPYVQNAYPALFMVIESSVEPDAVAASARDVLKSLDPTQPAERVETLATMAAASVDRERLALSLFGSMAFMALLLSVLGIWGVVEYSVRQSTRDIGLRMALGARPAVVFAGVLSDALRLVVAGLFAGAALVWPMALALRTFLFGVSPHDPYTLAAAALLLLAFALVAVAGPSSLAVRVDPSAALRTD